MDTMMVLVGMKVVVLKMIATVVWSSLAALPIAIGLILLLPMPTKRIGRNH